MFDIGWQELFVVAVLAIIVVGPKDIPRAIRTVTGWLRKAKGMARDFQNGMEDIVREVELEDIRKEAEEAAGFNLEDAAADFNLEDEIRKTIDPTGEVTKELEDLAKVTDEVDEDEATEEVAEEEEAGRTAVKKKTGRTAVKEETGRTTVKKKTGRTTAGNNTVEAGKKANG